MSPTVGIITLFVGFLISVAIRAPFEARSKKVATVVTHRDGLEIFLLAMMSLGLVVVPLVYALTDLFSFADHVLPTVVYWIGVIFLVAYLWLFYRSHADLGTNWSVTLEIKDKHALVTDGVYSRVRHPMYTSIYFYAIAQFLLLPNWVAGVASFVSFTLMYICRIGREERMMVETFGDTYRAYSRKTKRLIPGLFILAAFLFLAGCNAHPHLQYITASSMRQHLEVLASDSLEGREMATDGERKASAYIARTFRSLGLQSPPGTKDYLHSFEVVKDSIELATLRIGTTAFSLMTHGRIEPTLNTNAALIVDTIVFVGYGIDTVQYSDYKDIDVRGKTILICEGEPKTDSTHYLISGTDRRSQWSRYSTEGERKLAAAKARGAKAVFVYNETLDSISEGYARYATGGYHPPGKAERDKESIYMVIGNPVLKAMVGEAKAKSMYSALRRRDALGGSFTIPVPIEYHFRKSTAHTVASNVISYIEGTDKKDEYVIVSAHYDHLGKHKGQVYYGADDNGSGTSGLLAIAEGFSKAAANGKRPRRSVVFFCTTGEEKGLYGSKAYVANPPFALEQTVADLNTDMIGRIDSAHQQDSNYLYIIGDGRLSSELHEINERNNKEYTRLTLDYRLDDRNDPNQFYYRSDHYEFAKRKIPIIFYTSGMHRDYHKPSDTIDKIDFRMMEKRARLAFLTAWEIANREERLKVDRSGD